MDMIIENEKHIELNTNVVSVVLDSNVKDDWFYTNVYAVIIMTKRSNLITCINFVNATSMILFWSCKELFIQMITYRIATNLVNNLQL